ncbi:MAG: hypothetical protein QJR03_13560 [Sphaerobacter sp.]|nr:hypothetical protein [Sphaerobacter sp.]
MAERPDEPPVPPTAEVPGDDEAEEEIPRTAMVMIVVVALAVALLYLTAGGGHQHFH